MIKTPAKDLALVLLEMTDGKTHEEIQKFLKDFVKYLGKNGILREEALIIDEYRSLYNKKHNIEEATITLIEKLPEHSRTELREALKKKYQVQTVEMEEKIDTRLIGGMKVQVGDTVYDSSVRNTLRQLEAQLQK